MIGVVVGGCSDVLHSSCTVLGECVAIHYNAHARRNIVSTFTLISSTSLEMCRIGARVGRIGMLWPGPCVLTNSAKRMRSRCNDNGDVPVVPHATKRMQCVVLH